MYKDIDITDKKQLFRLCRDFCSAVLKVYRWGDKDFGRRFLQSFGVEKVVRMPVVLTDRQGLKYILYPDQNPRVYIEGNGNYEVCEEKFCVSYISEGMTVFDVGGNIGLYALLFSKMVGESGQVYSFEPEPLNYSRLVENIGLNRLKNVLAFELAIGEKPGQLSLNVYSEMFAAWHTFGRPKLPNPFIPGSDVDPDKKVLVPVDSLDEFCKENSVQVIDFIKVDVEGAELDVLLGSKTLLQTESLHVILFEVSKPQVEGFGRDGSEVFRLLSEFGLSFFEIDSSGRLSKLQAGLPVKIYQNFIAANSIGVKKLEQKGLINHIV